jgi:hypothetical protein
MSDKTIWEVIEQHSIEEKTAEEVLEAVLEYYKSKGMLITTQEGFLTHHAREL